VHRARGPGGRDLGEIPGYTRGALRARGERDLALWLKAYMPSTFRLPWADDHRKVIAMLERAVLEGGGVQSVGMPRGSGKTSIAEGATVWALSNGHRKFGCLIGPGDKHAHDRLASIKTQWEFNPRLLADYPEICFPIKRLEGISQRRLTYQGERVVLQWEGGRLLLPNIPGAPGGGALVSTCGIEGQVRGQVWTRTDLETARPDFVLIDDPQTRADAKNPATVDKLQKLILGDVLGLAGPGRKLSGVMLCTVIYPGDLSDRFLDHAQRPEWNGIRTRMVYQFPKREDLWSRYAELRRSGPEGIAAANEFYRENQAALEEGCVVAWAARFNEDELSAVQHAMNRKIDDPESFAAECQNEPLVENQDDELLEADEICRKLNRIDRGTVPVACQTVTAFVDVQKACLYWFVAGWDPRFGGGVVDYGTFPDQRRSYFALRDVQRTIERAFKAAGHRGGFEAALTWALGETVELILGREWLRDDGAPLRVERCLVDVGWGEFADEVFQFCRQSRYAAQLLPSRGVGIAVKRRPLAEWRKKPGDRADHPYWRIPATEKRGQVRQVMFDANYWKSFVHARLATADGDPGCLYLPGDRPDAHQLLAEHLTAEFRIKVKAEGREGYEWQAKVGAPDNHWLDGLVGCAVGASIQGVTLGDRLARAKKRRRISYF
jgi:hypothetical protein